MHHREHEYILSFCQTANSFVSQSHSSKEGDGRQKLVDTEFS
jgi:hypothetical protein